MATIDIFAGDAFSTFELTSALNRVPFNPQLLGSLGIFDPRPIRTEAAAFEQKNGKLTLIQTSERGAPLEQADKSKRDIRYFKTHRVARGDSLRASELQNIRAFGSESELAQVQTEVMERMTKLRSAADLTIENMRLGAVQGIVLDADGTQLNNWFTAWGQAQPDEIDFDLDAANPVSGAVKKLCNNVIRTMARNAQGAFTATTQVYALCGDNFYDDLTTHKEVIQTFLNQQAANDLREGYANVFESFRYGGITWINYRGTDDKATVAIGTDKVKFFPVGAPGVFQHVMSPGESFDYVNTPGLPYYAITVPDKDRNSFVDIEVYAYPLLVCTTPQVLLRGKRT